MTHDVAHYMRQGSLNLAALPPLSLYIHLPWCIKKCPYCDFNSHVWQPQSAPLAAGSGSAIQATKIYIEPQQTNASELPEQRYIDALVADLETALPLIWGRTVHSIFLGGGTPSLFSPQAIDRLLSAVRARLRLEADCEITLEANPGTFEKNRFRAFSAAGITRLSVGVQSFDDAHLQVLGRVHNRAQAIAAVEEAAQNFATFNLDLMYALPGQTLENLAQDLATALALQPKHLSIYHLSIEPNTYFAKYPPTIPDDDLAYAMLDCITEHTEKMGLARYEVSAYAQAGHACTHNLNYWQFGDYLGIGAGAHSKLSFAHRVLRQVRVRDPLRYMEAALQRTPVAQESEVTRADLPFEFMLNALRLKQGFSLQHFTERTGLPLTAIQKGLADAEQRGLIQRNWTHVWPTEQGFNFLNDLQSLFLAD